MGLPTSSVSVRVTVSLLSDGIITIAKMVDMYVFGHPKRLES